jgi:CheY-like chemotaxis protein
VTRVLVVEDDYHIRTLITDFLSLLGCTVDAASNGQEGLERIRDCVPDLILLDLMMPVMDGRQFSSAVRADRSAADVPIMLMSAAADARTAVGEIRAQGLLAKPFNLDQLANVIEQFRPVVL